MGDQVSSGCLEKVVTAVASSLITAALLWIAAHVYDQRLLAFLGGVSEERARQIVNEGLERKFAFSDIQAGRESVGSGTGQESGKEFDVSFPHPFSSIPIVVATAAAAPANQFDTFAVTTIEVTQTGFRGYVFPIGAPDFGQQLRVDWVGSRCSRVVGHFYALSERLNVSYMGA